MGQADLIAVADSVAREKSISADQVLEAMEVAIEKAARAKYGQEYDIHAHIDKKTGEIGLARYQEVVDDVINPAMQIHRDDAVAHKPDAQIGSFIITPLPPIDFGRIAAQTARQVIIQRIREAERDQQYAAYKDSGGEIVNGVVLRIEFGNVIVDLGRGEGYLRRDEIIPRERFRRGDRVRALIYDVQRTQRGPQIFLSRTHPQFMVKLFTQEVPEIYENIVEIKGVARDPGSRAKIAVLSNDPSIDPVGACVGIRGSRVQAIVGELQGERVDIIPWTEDIGRFVISALQPAEISKVVLDEEQGKIEVVLREDQLSLAIGRRGQNVRLASMLAGWDIDILTETEESERRQKNFEIRSKLFMEALDVDDIISRLLAVEGFRTIDEIAYVDLDEMAAIDGFDEDIAQELQSRARAWKKKQEEEAFEALNINPDMHKVKGLTLPMFEALAKGDVHKLEDFAGLSDDELSDKKDGILKDFNLTTQQAQYMIMQARADIGWITQDDMKALKQAMQAEIEASQVDTEMFPFAEETPKADTQTFEADTQTPEADTQTLETDTQTPKADTQTPEVVEETPDVEIETPDVETEMPDIEK